MESPYNESDMDDHDWLITRCGIFPEKEEERMKPLKEFVCPPLVPSRRSTRRYSFMMRTLCVGGVISESEKKGILSRLRPSPKITEDEFQTRLSRVRDRNKADYIQTLQLRAATRIAVEQDQHRLEYEERNERRKAVFARRMNLRNILYNEIRMCRAKRWYTIILSHVFLTALMKERRIHEAREKLSWMLVPIIKRRAQVRRRREEAAALTQRNLGNIPFPSTSVIESMSGTFFKGWPPRLLEMLARKARPTYLKAGSFMMHEGDLDRCMYMITTGTVVVILNDRNKGKKRTRECSKACLTLTPPCYVGEFALVCKEPRSASIQCETHVGAWSVSPEDYDDVAQHLSAEVASKQREATDVRRRANLQKFFPLRVEFLRHFSYFEKFSADALNQIISAVEPIVLHDGDCLFSRSEMDSSAYFIQDGVAILVDEDGGERAIPPGSCVGIFECSCGVNERKKCTIVSQNYCDIWRMRRDVLLDVGMSEPAAFLFCRSAAKLQRAQEVVKPLNAHIALRKDPYMLFCLTRQIINRLWEFCTPAIYLNDEKLVIQGTPFQQFIIMHSGSFETTVPSSSGEHKKVRIKVDIKGSTTEVSSHLYGTSSPGSKSKNGIFPSLVLGAYEYITEMSQYCSTITSYGVSEVFVVDRARLDALVPAELKATMLEDTTARELVQTCSKDRDVSVLTSNMHLSFASTYRRNKDLATKNEKA